MGETNQFANQSLIANMIDDFFEHIECVTLASSWAQFGGFESKIDLSDMLGIVVCMSTGCLKHVKKYRRP